MADYGLKPDIPLGVKNPTPMSLSDLVSMARAIQQYKQAEEYYPIELQRAAAERDVAVGTVKPRITKAGIEADEATFGLQRKILSHTRGEIAELLKKENLTYGDVEDAVKRTVEHTQAPADVKERAIKSAMADFGQNDSVEKLRSALAGALVKTTSQENQLSARLPKPTMLDIGGNKIPVSEGNQLVTGVAPGTQIGVGYKTSPAPTLMATATGEPGQFGGGPVTTINPPKNLFTTPSASTAPAAGVPAAPVSPAVSQVQSGFAAKGGLQLAPGETYDAYRARVAELSKLPSEAIKALNPKNVESIPNMEYTNDQVLKLLENPKLDVGPIANAIKNKTGGIGLTADQQKIMKYLEQRIRQESARSNLDQESQAKAFGDFGTNKEALRGIIYDDKTRLASARLFNEGIRNAQGNPNEPNLGAINAFTNKFSALAGDRDLMTFIGIFGNKSFDNLSKTDKEQLKKYFGNRGGDPVALLNELESKREALMKLVKGSK